jgi:16S rRNA (guanine527-N7)-methyltransferase
LSASATAPEDEGHALTACCQNLGLAAEPAQIVALSTYLDLLERWNATYNLTAVRGRVQMRSQHLADCLAVIPSLVRYAQPKHNTGPGLNPSSGAPPKPHTPPIRLLDVGSGGGLPGVLIALFQPEWQVTCVDAVGKKAAFIQQVAGRLALPNLHAVHNRVENLKAGASAIARSTQGAGAAGTAAAPAGDGEGAAGCFDLITSRAFSSLADLVRLTRHLLAPGGVWAAMKGRLEEGELAQLAATSTAADGTRAVAAALVFHVEQLTVPGLDAQRCLVWMRSASDPDSARAGTPAAAS